MADVAADYLGLPHNAEEPRLYRNNGDGTFADVTREAGLDEPLIAMGSNFGDLDNDGFPDCYIGTGDPYMVIHRSHRMFRNAAGRFIQDVTTSPWVRGRVAARTSSHPRGQARASHQGPDHEARMRSALLRPALLHDQTSNLGANPS